MKQYVKDYADFAIAIIAVATTSIIFVGILFDFFATSDVIYGVNAGRYMTDTYYFKEWFINYLAIGFPYFTTIFLFLTVIIRIFTKNLIINFGLPLLVILTYSFFWNIPSSARTFVLAITFFVLLYFMFITLFLTLRIFILFPAVMVIVYALTLAMITLIAVEFIAIHTETYSFIKNSKPLFVIMLYVPKIIAVILMVILMLSLKFFVKKIKSICKELNLSKTEMENMTLDNKYNSTFVAILNKLVIDKSMPQDIVNILIKLK